MTTTTQQVPAFSVAGRFLEGLAQQDFDLVSSALSDDARLRALVPSGGKEWTGAEVRARIRFWFGDTDAYELLDATVGEVAGRIHLRWRVRLRAPRLGDGWFVIEQQVYADASPEGLLDRLDLLCSGFRPEAGAADVRRPSC